MMRTLRSKLALSHIIPTVLLLPILSLYLLYTLEGFFTDQLDQQLAAQSKLLRYVIERNPALIGNQQAASDFLAAVGHLTDSRVLLVDQNATVIASTEKEDVGRIGTRLDYAAVAQALRGEMTQGVGPGFTAEVAYVVIPLQFGGQTTGALRLSYQVSDVRAQFEQLRWLIVGGVVLTVVLALGLALGLATTITRPLRLLSESAQQIAAGDYRARVAARGRDEVGVLAQSFNQMVERLEEAKEARELQLAAIVHELARPLTGMRSGIETLREGSHLAPAMHDALLEGVEHELDRLERLIGTLQVLHKRALRPLELNRTPVALERVIRACVANFEPLADKSGITLAMEAHPPLPHIDIDEDRIIQVLTNLLDNAIKFTPRGGRVTVTAGEDNAAVHVSVTDTGVGIAPEESPHLFQQFYRGADSRPPEKKGMGLGLAICREIVKAHHGEIWVESKPNHGARFTFTLPKDHVTEG